MANNRIVNFQLCDMDGKAILSSGGMAQICVDGSPDKVSAVYDATQAATTNPVALSRGMLYVEVAKSVTTVDIYLATPTGHFLVLKDVVPGDRSVVKYEPKDLETMWVIPFSHADSTAATEKDTGFDLPVGAIVKGLGAGIEVVDVDATETIDAGTLSTESGGDANGFLALASVATAGVVKATVAATATLGALLKINFATTPAVDVPEGHVVVSGTQSISYTTTAGSDTVSGFILLPVNVAKTSALVG